MYVYRFTLVYTHICCTSLQRRHLAWRSCRGGGGGAGRLPAKGQRGPRLGGGKGRGDKARPWLRAEARLGKLVLSALGAARCSLSSSPSSSSEQVWMSTRAAAGAPPARRRGARSCGGARPSDVVLGLPCARAARATASASRAGGAEHGAPLGPGLPRPLPLTSCPSLVGALLASGAGGSGA